MDIRLPRRRKRKWTALSKEGSRIGFTWRTRRASRAASVLLSAVLLGGLANAADPAQAAGEAQVLSGGVGEGARKQLSEKAREYNLKLVFTLSTGNFLSDVAFEIHGGGNRVVSARSQGPWAFVKLPPGSYSVTATHEGFTQTRKVNVPRKGQRSLPFSWPAPARVKDQPK